MIFDMYVIWYLKPLISSNKSLYKYLMLNFLAPNWTKESFEYVVWSPKSKHCFLPSPSLKLFFALNSFLIFLNLLISWLKWILQEAE